MKRVSYIQVKNMSRIYSDGSIFCIPKGYHKIYIQDNGDHKGDMYIKCKAGNHYIDAHIRYDGYLEGLYKK